MQLTEWEDIFHLDFKGLWPLLAGASRLREERQWEGHQPVRHYQCQIRALSPGLRFLCPIPALHGAHRQVSLATPGAVGGGGAAGRGPGRGPFQHCHVGPGGNGGGGTGGTIYTVAEIRGTTV